MDSFRYKIIREIQLKNNDFFVLIYGFIIGTAQKGILSDETGEELYTVWTTGGLVSKDDSECAAPYAVTVCLDNVNDKEITSQQAGEMARDILLFLTEEK